MLEPKGGARGEVATMATAFSPEDKSNSSSTSSSSVMEGAKQTSGGWTSDKGRTGERNVWGRRWEEKESHSESTSNVGGSNFRVLIASEDTKVEALLKKYNVDAVHVLTSSPFSKATAIMDAAAKVPLDQIILVHDADLIPPCDLPDILRRTVIQGRQAVNFLVPYEGMGKKGTCTYPTSTFGPIAMYSSDFVSVGGLQDTNQGRWGYEDTVFIHKVMLGKHQLGVLRAYHPGLTHKWHETTPWKCPVLSWGVQSNSTT
ncbi:unnamed protein product [Choristocarpus tenellus]